MKNTKIIVGGAALVSFLVVLIASYIFQDSGGSGDISSSGKTRVKQYSTMPRFTAGSLEIAITTEPETPHVGDNKLILQITDQGGKPLGDVDINAYAEMPAMGAMPAMRAPASLRQTAAGRFEGELDLSMRGEWPLTVQILNTPDGDKRLQFDLATDRTGLTIAAGGVPVGGEPVGRMMTARDSENIIIIDNRRRQMIGLKTGLVTHRDLLKSIRAVGEVRYDERLLSQVALKFDGYIGDLKADYLGAKVEKGQTLFTVYSPELLAAQQEYLETRKRRSAHGTADPLLKAARQRLRLWDMTTDAIKALERRGSPQDYVAISAPRSGTLIERHIVDGGAAQRGKTLLSIADLSRVWVEAEVFEADLDLVKTGMQTTVSLPYLPGRSYSATVEYIYPYLQSASRTGRIRLTLDNASGELKPGMYAEVSLHVGLGHRLSVPEEAIVVAGESRIVFVDLGGGQLKPVWIKTGRRAQGFVEVTEGLNLGDVIVTSGNFLVAAETRLKTGIEQW